ncbi:MAG: SPFH domain-containing protein [Synergistaceae bacterium]|nr:SPFH domain-containing protein [Synergistaceae bacterium]
MAWFGQGKDTIEWEEFRDDILFYKWPANEIKKGSKLIIRTGQNAIFYANGQIEGIFKDEGNFDIETQITPFLSTLKGFFSLRGDTGMRAEVYFVNAKQLLLPWGTRQRIMIPSPEVPSGIPIGCNGNLIVEFRDYLTFIKKVAGVKSTYSLSDISERLMGVLNPIIAECILHGERQIGVNALVGLQANSRALGKEISAELDKELLDIGLGVASLNIQSVNYPKEVQAMAEKVAAQSFIGDVGKYATVSMADSFGNAGGGGVGGAAAQMGMGLQMGQQMMAGMQQTMQQPAQQQPVQQQAPQPAPAPAAAGWACPCGHTGNTGKFCAECGKPQPVADTWTCGCGEINKGKFCAGCGKPKPAGVPQYKCDKCGWEPEDKTHPPKFCPECGDPFDEGDIVK